MIDAKNRSVFSGPTKTVTMKLPKKCIDTLQDMLIDEVFPFEASLKNSTISITFEERSSFHFHCLFEEAGCLL